MINRIVYKNHGNSQARVFVFVCIQNNNKMRFSVFDHDFLFLFCFQNKFISFLKEIFKTFRPSYPGIVRTKWYFLTSKLNNTELLLPISNFSESISVNHPHTKSASQIQAWETITKPSFYSLFSIFHICTLKSVSLQFQCITRGRHSKWNLIFYFASIF